MALSGLYQHGNAFPLFEKIKNHPDAHQRRHIAVKITRNHSTLQNPSKPLQIFPNPPNPQKFSPIFPNHQKSPETFSKPKPPPQPPQNHPPNPPEHPQTSPHPPQTHQNISQIRRNHPIRQISGQNLTPLSANFSTAFGKFGTSREPVGNQSGTSRENPCTAPKGTKMLVFAGIWHFFSRFLAKTLQKVPNSTKKVPNPCKNQHFCAFWGGARIFPTGSRLVPDWFPTGSRLVPNLPKAVSDFNFLGVKKTRCFGLKPAESRPNPSQSLGFLVIFPLDWHFERG